MTKPKIEDFIPPGWHGAMDEDGSVFVSQDRPVRSPAFFYTESGESTRLRPRFAAMFDLSIFGDNWKKSLFQKPPERGPIACPFCGCREFEYKYTNNTWQHEVGGCPLAGLCFNENDWRMRPKKPSKCGSAGV